MSVTLWHYPRCSTCKRALKWAAAAGVEVRELHIVEQPPSVEQLRSLWQRSGLPLKRFFNTSGQSYRAGGWKDRWDSSSDEEKLAALAADGMLIKRPLVDGGDVVLLGFQVAAWEAALIPG